jgi:hypothetical protein
VAKLRIYLFPAAQFSEGKHRRENREAKNNKDILISRHIFIFASPFRYNNKP